MHIREKNEAIVVEGYFDLISLYQAGIKNVVAVSGTGFTTDQAALLARFCERIVLLYDSDSAGIKAAFRACGVLYDSGVEPRIIRLPKGHDPDSFAREAGKEGLLKQVAGATDVVDFIKNGFSRQICRPAALAAGENNQGPGRDGGPDRRSSSAGLTRQAYRRQV